MRGEGKELRLECFSLAERWAYNREDFYAGRGEGAFNRDFRNK